MIHLDTSFLIEAVRGDAGAVRKLQDWDSRGETLAISSVAWAEFLCGPLADGDLELAVQIVREPQNFTPEHAVIAARLFNVSGRRRGTVVDCMIAAAAIASDAPLATDNTDDFARFVAHGLRLA